MAKDAAPDSASLEIDGLCVATARGRALLDVPGLSVASGTLLGVRGPSGAGKSTFLHAVSGLLDSARGRVIWGGEDILALSTERRAAFRADKVGMVFQDFMLFDEMSPMANATISGLFRRGPGLSEAAGDLLSRLRVRTEARSVASYSGGEKQRIAVARALAARPGIVLADEPTASLDRVAADRLIEDLVSMVRSSGATLIAVSHDEHLLSALDRVITLEDGGITRDEEVPS
ncbi:ABC transporter ATP-binding protein [Primorskyibacter aestuariivivens]|uniref:ABC transporter ATP-binding protein n=1 Tax=Primorskyibacter aestuariivivens TaxID=1888912 RepID=UPI0023011C27|nr:ABC transporter ATP-binding protein [Primorskyibacter aestuariivivens]MDA7427837.1 ABC transporter ATP-binding protein [Primorskyibacter aestuariivivens]